MRKILLKIFRHQTLYWLRQDLLSLKSSLFSSKFRKQKPNARFLNLGCGTSGINDADWINLDGAPLDSVDVVHNLIHPLPFEAERFSGIFSEHCFEHLTPEEGKAFLKESFRVLKSGGTIRISVPDGELYLDKYFTDPDWVLKRRDGRFRTRMEVINEVFRQRYEHQYTYDFETISLYLNETGFVNCKKQGYGNGSVPELLIDKENRAFESLIVEAQKP